MAVYRQIHIEFWQDGFVLDLTPEEKYFYIYIMTNSKTSQCGIYELPKRIIETETGYNRETVDKLLQRFIDYKKIIYCEETKEIFIINWIKHNSLNSPKVKKCIEKELTTIKNKEFIKIFYRVCKQYKYSIDTVCIDYGEEEKEEEKEKEKEEQQQEKEKKSCKNKKQAEVDKCKNNSVVAEYIKVYENYIEPVNKYTEEWILTVSKRIDIDLFKRAVDIAIYRERKHRGYVDGIINQWIKLDIRSITDLNSYTESLKKGVNKNENHQHTKHELATGLYDEDESIYQKPSEEQLNKAKALL